MNRPDFSNYIAHFTSGSGNIKSGHTPGTFETKAKMSAKNKLISILTDKKIIATPMPWTKANAVCFTECPWASLIAHTKRYSPYGIGFNKPFVFSRNGGPAIYIRPDNYKDQMDGGKFTKHLWPFVTPFAPSYRPDWMKERHPMADCDYSHEREWRVPHDFEFEYSNIEFVILKNYDDMAKFPTTLKDAIGRDKFILMENYKLIETIWPVHNL
jgi:hypothetical protein